MTLHARESAPCNGTLPSADHRSTTHAAVLKATLPIINKLGLHARAAAKFVGVTGAYAATIKVTCGTRTANGKSITGVMMLGARLGKDIDVEVDGEDEAALLEALRALLANRFGEGE